MGWQNAYGYFVYFKPLAFEAEKEN